MKNILQRISFRDEGSFYTAPSFFKKRIEN